MDSKEWNAALAASVHWKDAYPLVAREARTRLTRCQAGKQFTTNQVVEMLYPEDLIVADGRFIRDRIAKGLMAQAIRDLADCAARGPTKKVMGKTVQPWLWHAPSEANSEAVTYAVSGKIPEPQLDRIETRLDTLEETLGRIEELLTRE